MDAAGSGRVASVPVVRRVRLTAERLGVASSGKRWRAFVATAPPPAVCCPGTALPISSSHRYRVLVVVVATACRRSLLLAGVSTAVFPATVAAALSYID